MTRRCGLRIAIQIARKFNSKNKFVSTNLQWFSRLNTYFHCPEKELQKNEQNLNCTQLPIFDLDDFLQSK